MLVWMQRSSKLLTSEWHGIVFISRSRKAVGPSRLVLYIYCIYPCDPIFTSL